MNNNINNNKKDLIVTLADANFIEQAKQLFSSVYFNAGWQGDYLLLASGLTDENKQWFIDKGILVYDCQLLSSRPVGAKEYPAIVLSKFYLFKEYFKQWRQIIFLDADIIVTGSLNKLLEIDYFGAPGATITFRGEFQEDDWRLLKKLEKKYRLTGQPFNSGVFTFNSDLINNKTFDDIMSLFKEFGSLNVHGEEATLNLFFYKNFTNLPMVYNSIPTHMSKFYKIDKQKLIAFVIHFVNSVKPWTNSSPYYHEWLENLQKANSIDLANRPLASEPFSEAELVRYLKYLRKVDFMRSWRLPFLFINSQIGQLGLFIKRKNPKLYKIISLKKNVLSKY